MTIHLLLNDLFLKSGHRVKFVKSSRRDLPALLFNPSPSFCGSRSEERLQRGPLHGVQPASTPTEAGDGPEAPGPRQRRVRQLQHLPGLHQRPAAPHPHLLLRSRLRLQLGCSRHLLLW